MTAGFIWFFCTFCVALDLDPDCGGDGVSFMLDEWEGIKMGEAVVEEEEEEEEEIELEGEEEDDEKEEEEEEGEGEVDV